MPSLNFVVDAVDARARHLRRTTDDVVTAADAALVRVRESLGSRVDVLRLSVMERHASVYMNSECHRQQPSS
jgi:hypothetical protein